MAPSPFEAAAAKLFEGIDMSVGDRPILKQVFTETRRPPPVPAAMQTILDRGNTLLPEYAPGDAPNKEEASLEDLERRYARLRFISMRQNGMKLRDWYVNFSLSLNPGNLSPLAQTIAMGEKKALEQMLDMLRKLPGMTEQRVRAFFASATEWTFRFSLIQIACAGYQRGSRHEKEARQDYFDIIDMLIAAGCDVNHRELCGYTAFFQSLLHEPKIALAKFLVSRGADPNLPNIYGASPLMECIMAGPEEPLEYLLSIAVCQKFRDADGSDAETILTKGDTLYSSLQVRVAAKRAKKKMREAGELACAACGAPRATETGWNELKQCSRCHVVKYCSRDCQTKHWKEHKLVCKAPAKSASAKGSDVVQVSVGVGMASSFMDKMAAMTSLGGGKTSRDSKFKDMLEGSEVGKHAPQGKFMVKIQVPMIPEDEYQAFKRGERDDAIRNSPFPMSHMVYNEDRSYSVRIGRNGNEAAFDKIMTVTREKGIMGGKIYVDAWVPSEGGKRLDGKLCIDLAALHSAKKW